MGIPLTTAPFSRIRPIYDVCKIGPACLSDPAAAVNLSPSGCAAGELADAEPLVVDELERRCAADEDDRCLALLDRLELETVDLRPLRRDGDLGAFGELHPGVRLERVERHLLLLAVDLHRQLFGIIACKI